MWTFPSTYSTPWQAAAVVGKTERNLPVRELSAVHVDLEDDLGRGRIAGHPDAVVAVRDPARVLRLALEGLEGLALPVHESRIVRLLLANPQSLGRDRDAQPSGLLKSAVV
jgi:hypothetical protein